MDDSDDFDYSALPGCRPDFARHARLAQLEPIEAVRALFAGDFGIGEEAALCFAIRQDDRVTLSDDALMDRAFDALDRGQTPEAFFDQITRS